jgi:hypothetical protein
MECAPRVILDVLVATVHVPVPIVGQQRAGILNYTCPKDVKECSLQNAVHSRVMLKATIAHHKSQK